MYRVIGITGTNGAGKGTVVDYLVKQKNFTHYSVSGFIAEEVERRGLPANRPNLIAVGNDLRKRFGPLHLEIALYVRAKKAGMDSIIESLRIVPAALFLQHLGVYVAGISSLVIGVDAAPELRYARARARGGVKDNVSFEEFCAQERSEMSSGDLTYLTQDLLGTLARANVVLQNNGTLEELHAQIDQALSAMHSRA